MQKLWKVIGPIVLSALSIFISILILQPIALWLDPSFSLLANRGIGKIGITVLVIWQIILLLLTQSRDAFKDFLQTNILFLMSTRWVKDFFKFFGIFAALHIFFLSLLFFAGFAYFEPVSINFGISLFLKILLGFIATFFLAWTEELIFRGTIYKIFVAELKPITSAIIASFIFMLAHNLTNPIALITSDWKLGLGLFLLGLLLNLVFIITGKLYTGMGIHAGLVFVKVFLRRVPILTFLPTSSLPFFINKDLRQSILVHLIFFATNIILIFRFKDRLFKKL